jgi:hypothetical protein
MDRTLRPSTIGMESNVNVPDSLYDDVHSDSSGYPLEPLTPPSVAFEYVANPGALPGSEGMHGGLGNSFEEITGYPDPMVLLQAQGPSALTDLTAWKHLSTESGMNLPTGKWTCWLCQHARSTPGLLICTTIWMIHQVFPLVSIFRQMTDSLRVYHRTCYLLLKFGIRKRTVEGDTQRCRVATNAMNVTENSTFSGI